MDAEFPQRGSASPIDARLLQGAKLPSATIGRLLHPADRWKALPDDAFAQATSISLNKDGSVMADYEDPRTGLAMKVRIPQGKTAWLIYDERVWVLVPATCQCTSTSQGASDSRAGAASR